MVEDRLVESRKKEGKDTGVKNVSKRKDETVAISSGFALRGLLSPWWQLTSWFSACPLTQHGYHQEQELLQKFKHAVENEALESGFTSRISIAGGF